MSVQINIPTPLRAYTDGKRSVALRGETVGQALENLMENYPQLKKHLRDGNGKLRSFVNIYVGDEDIRSLENESTELQSGDELSIIPSIAGGHR